MILAAVDERGLVVSWANQAGVRGLTFCRERDSSMDLAKDQTRQQHLGLKSRLSHQLPSCSARLTLLVVKDDTSFVVHDMTTPNEINSRSDRCRSAPSVQHTQVSRAMIDGRISMQTIVIGIMSPVLLISRDRHECGGD